VLIYGDQCIDIYGDLRRKGAQGRTAGRGTCGVEGPGGQRQKDVSTALSSSKEAKTGNLSMRFSLYDINLILLIKEHVSVYLLVSLPN
jgi:hypothetical protein